MPKTAHTGVHLALQIDLSSADPAYKQVCDQLREAITRGRLHAGAKLPSTRILSNEIGLSRNTLIRAFEILTTEGYLSGRVGAGTFVAAGSAPRPMPSDEQTKANSFGSYPFRSLSKRGRTLVAAAAYSTPEKPIPFALDLNDAREFPIRTWLRLLSEVSGGLTREALATPSNAGYVPLRRAIAETLGASRGMDCTEEQVVITTGSQQGLDLICRVLLDPGDPVWLENPGYIGTKSIVAASGARAIPMSVDDDGARIGDAINGKPNPRLIIVSPSRHYPLGATLSLGRRLELINFAKNSGCWIVEDDYDCEMRYSGISPPSIYGKDESGRTIYMGTFSKILMPAFRLGYLVLPMDLVEPFRQARSVVDRHASLIDQMALAEFIKSGLFASHVRKVRGLVRMRQQTLITGLKSILGNDVVFPAVETGTHITLFLNDKADDVSLREMLDEKGIVTRALSNFYDFNELNQGLLFGFSSFRPEEITNSLLRFRECSKHILSCICENRGR